MSSATQPGSGVDVSFCLQTGGDDCVDERELVRNLDDYRTSLKANTRLDGAIVITAPGGPTVEYEDEVPPAVQDLCFGSIPDLAAGKTVDITTFSYPGKLRLVPQGDGVLISGDVVPTTRLPLRPLLKSLYDCGQRFIIFARQLKGNEYEHVLTPLEARGRAAAEVLDKVDR